LFSILHHKHKKHKKHKFSFFDNKKTIIKIFVFIYRMSLVFGDVEITNNISGQGLSSRRPARLATTAAGTLATSFANGQTIDDVTLVTNDRILIKNQASGIENGVYVVNATGAPSRTPDYDDGDAVSQSFIFIQEGNVNGMTGWLCININGSDIVATDALLFSLITGDISGTGASTDNAIVRWDGTTGTMIQDSSILVDDSNNMTGLQYLQFSDITAPSNPSAGQGRMYKKTGDDGIFWKPDAAGPEIDLTTKTLIIQDEGTGVTGTPHTTLNFVGSGVTVTNAGSGVATVTIGGGVTGVTTWSAGTTGLTPATATTGAVTLAGTLIAANGGTGFNSYTVGDIIAAGTTTTFSKVSDVATGNVLLSGGVGVVPLYGKVGLTTHVSGVLPIANGGTNLSTTPTNGQLLIGNGTNYTLSTLTQGTGVGIVNASGSITISNTGVLSLTTNTGLSTNVSATGAVTVTNTGVLSLTTNTGLSTNVSATGAVTVTNTGLVNVQDEGVAITGTPHSTLNFVGTRITATNAGSGVANVTVITPVTTKGDIYTFDTDDQRLPVGANNTILMADSATSTGLIWNPFLRPSQLPGIVISDTIAADQNNYNPANIQTAVQVRITATGANRSITGIVIAGSAIAPVFSELKLTNVGLTNNIILRSENAGSTAANRFLFDGQDVVIVPGQSYTIFYDFTTARWRGVASSQDGRMGGMVVNSGVLTAPPFAVSQNNYNPVGLELATVLRVQATALSNITGLAGGVGGRIIYLVNVGTIPIKLITESTLSIAANRLYTGTSDATLVGNATAALLYDGISNIWRITGGTGGVTSGAGGLVQSQWVEVNNDLSTTATTWPTAYTFATAAATLPQATITVNNTNAYSSTPTRPGSPGFPTAGKLIIQTSNNDAQIITYTGKTATTFTGCTGGTGNIVSGCYIHAGPSETTIAVGSNGLSLPQTTINVVSTALFPTSGRILVDTSIGRQRVLYTGTTATTFTGCTLGAGVMSTGGIVTNISPTSQDVMEINLTTAGGAIIISSTANASTDSNRTGYFQLVFDGYIRRGGSTQGNGGAPAGSAVIGLKLSPVLAGDHNVVVRWVTEGGTFAIFPVTAAADNNASLLVQEVSS